MNAVSTEVITLPAPVARRGITEPQWRTAMNSLFPGAKPESVIMAFDYCAARKLDLLKKPCHIVPMQVKVGRDYEWRDVIMPGIYEYRTTAMRTGEYMGHSRPEYGPLIEFGGVQAPEWCSLTVFRWNKAAQVKTEFPVTIYFSECAATKNDGSCNARWSKAPRQMLTKVTEAAGLREAFPDELGGEHTAEEMQDQSVVETIPAPIRTDPRGDQSNIDFEARDKHVQTIADILAEYGSDETVAPIKFREYYDAELQPFPELWIAVHDALTKGGIISKAVIKKYLA